MSEKITISDLLKNTTQTLSLSLISGEQGLNRIIKVPEINKLGLALVGHFAYFSAERIQICGMTEHSYLETISNEIRYNVLKQMFASFPQIPCIILTRNIDPHTELVNLTADYSIPLLRTTFTTAKFISELSVYLEKQLSPSTTLHGVLVNIHGLGVLILGESGIGKSECALELLKRGHMLVGDDVIAIRRRPGGVLIGTAQQLIQHHMEIRGLGIIDVNAIFGVGAILNSAKIELVVKLEEWQPASEYDRLGMEELSTNILGIDVPEVLMPVRPGRNLAVLIEISALNQRLKQKGHYSARELDKKLIEIMTSKTKGAEKE